ncbi:MAG: hypothetical protein C0412_18160 [Flavobacterium sp.]|nr:hypothetical protein [Flavobacterium sp.]
MEATEIRGIANTISSYISLGNHFINYSNIIRSTISKNCFSNIVYKKSKQIIMHIIPFDHHRLGFEDPNKYNDFSRFSAHTNDGIFIESSWFDDTNILKKSKGKKIAYIEFEEPNRFFVLHKKEFIPNTHDAHKKQYSKILTLCPFTAKWLNKKYNTNQRTSVFQPFNEQFIPLPAKKKNEVIYAGHIVSLEIENVIKTISKFNYRFISDSTNSLVTDKGVSYQEKLRLISETKISVVNNLLYPTYSHIQSVWSIPDYYNNEAFCFIPKRLPRFVPNIFKHLFISKEKVVVPQIKQRLFEAAFCRSLILCQKDPFNVIEQFFSPEIEFVYYEEDKLAERITEILSNFEHYQPIINNAFKKAVAEYTTKRFAEKYLVDLF